MIMTTKRVFLFIALCFSIAFAQAQTAVEVTTAASGGDLVSKLNAQGITSAATASSVTSLKINGGLTAADLTAVEPWFKATLKVLDLSGVTLLDNNGTLAANAFRYYTVLETVKLSGAFKTLGVRSFYQMPKLKEIELAEGLEDIGSYAFSAGTTTATNNSLTSITFPVSLKRVGYGAFRHCKFLTTVTFLGSNLDFLGGQAFYGSTALETVTLPASITEFDGYQTFCGAIALTSVNLPATTTVNQWAAATSGSDIVKGTVKANKAGVFEDTFSPNDFNLNTSFGSSGSLTSISLPAGVTKLEKTFYQQTALTSVTLNEGLEVIGDRAFYYNLALKNITIPYTVTEIGSQAFNQISALETVTFEAGGDINEPYLETVGASAFASSNKLIIALPCGDAEWIPTATSSTFASEASLLAGGAKLYVPAAAIASYKAATGWKNFGDNVLDIATLAAKQAQSIENFTDINAGAGDGAITLSATATSGLDVTYSIEAGKEGVATLNGNVLTIVGAGTAQITASQAGDDSYEAAADVTVTLTVQAAVTATGIRLAIKLAPNATVQLSAAVEPAGASQNVTWSSSDDNKATVNNGLVTAVNSGSSVITATAFGTELKVEINIDIDTSTDDAPQGIAGNSAAFRLQENPVINEARFTFESVPAGGASITLADLNGKIVATKHVASGASEAIVNVSSLPKGVYVASYSDNAGKQGSVKLVK